jgi:hypothetical protein
MWLSMLKVAIVVCPFVLSSSDPLKINHVQLLLAGRVFHLIEIERHELVNKCFRLVDNNGSTIRQL